MNSADLFNAKEFDGKTITYNRTKTKDRRNDNAIMQVDVHPTIAPLVENTVIRKEFSISMKDFQAWQVLIAISILD